MRLPGVPYRVGLILGILIVTLGCASPTPVPENRAIATGPSQAQSLASSPRFSAGGPDAEKYGATEGYPVKAISRLPFFVGSFSHYDQLLEGRTIRRAAVPSRLLRAPTEPALHYEYQGETRSLDDYLARNPATGLLIARGDTILVERYQYARTDRHRLTSFSMAKTVTAMLIGIALAENLIRSIDDPAATYLPALADTEYGRTSLRHLLQMSSGVRFRENYSGQDDVARLFAATVLQEGPGGVAAVTPYNERARWSGAVFSYASVETQVLGLVLRSVVGRPVAEYFRDRIWEPIGAEADATWIIDAAGQEATYCCLNAVLRDYARLGLLLAHDGRLGDRQIIPETWVHAATTIAANDWHLKGVWQRTNFGYGYQTWIFAGERRMFALIGVHGQAIYVDPSSRLVMVHTAVRQRADDPNEETIALWLRVVDVLGTGRK
jgi:CubicO group peptidase (beta-lactamase class C family)